MILRLIAKILQLPKMIHGVRKKIGSSRKNHGCLGKASTVLGKYVASIGKYVLATGKCVSAAGKYVLAAGKYVSAAGKCVSAAGKFYFGEKGKKRRREVEEDDYRSTGPFWSFAWYFPANFFLKNNNNQKDQMQKKNKELYATVGKKNYLCTAIQSAIYSSRVGRGRENFLPWCQLILWIAGDL